MIKNTEIQTTGHLIKRPYLTANKFIQRSTLFGDNINFSFYSLKGQIRTFQETLAKPSSSEYLYKRKYSFNPKFQLTHIESIPKNNNRFVSIQEGFDDPICQKRIIENYSSKNELLNTKTLHYNFNELIQVDDFNLKTNKRQERSINTVRMTKLNNSVYLVENDKQSKKIKYYIEDNIDSVVKTVEYRNSKYSKYKRTKIFNSFGQIIETIREDLSKPKNIEYEEKIKYKLDKQNNIEQINTKRFVDGKYQENLINYHYRFKRLIKVGDNLRIKYDYLGNPSMIESHIGKFEYKYRYDLKGNWINLLVTFIGNGNKQEQLFNRKYEYK